MSEYTPHGDPFDELTADLFADRTFTNQVNGLIQNHEHSGQCHVSLQNDIRCLRDAFSDHVKAAMDLGSDAELSDQEYSYIEYIMNQRDISALRDLKPGDTVEIHEGALTIYMTDQGVACENITEGEVIVGDFDHVAIAPIPTIETMLCSGEGVDEMNFEPTLMITNPRLELDDGRAHLTDAPQMYISISDPEVLFYKRINELPTQH